jgi:hypothetical protein
VTDSVKAHLRYAGYVLRHKWFVFVAGRKTKAPLWRLVVHDWSKLLPIEWFPYVQNFYGEELSSLPRYEQARRERQARFDKAWLHHQHRNPHHWQHWLLREDDGPLKALPMPEHFIREMVADWMGAGRAITGRWAVREWYAQNSERMDLHPRTRERVEELMPTPEPGGDE